MAELVEGHSPYIALDQWRKLKEIDSMTYANGEKLLPMDAAALKTAYVNPVIDYDSVFKALNTYVIPANKLLKYALDPIRQPDKARAFRGYLSYTKSDASTVAALVYEYIAAHAPAQTAIDEYGERMTSAMVMNGKTGKVAKVMAGWITDPETDRIRLTTIYVNE